MMKVPMEILGGIGMKCPKCGWQGDESDLIRVPADLETKDGYFTVLAMTTLRRWNYLCPSCQEALRTARQLYGFEHRKEDL
jgi:hypothetical protein